MNLIIIEHEPYRQFKSFRYYLKSFLQDGYRVEYWSVCNAFNYTKKTMSLSDDRPNEEFDVIEFKNVSDLLNKIDELDPKKNIICLEVWFNWDTLRLFRKLKSKKFSVFQIDYFMNHPALALASNSNKISYLLEKLSLKGVTKRIFNFMNFKLVIFLRHIFNPISLLFIPGINYKEYFSNVKFKSINYFDVDLHEQAIDSPSVVDEKYIVFLDEFLPFHPDLLRIDKKTISPEVYYPKLNKLFDKIESNTKTRIIIAAHPKSNYRNEFDGRVSIKGKTPELVNNAEMVLAHSSASINLAVLSNKKVLLIYTDEFLRKDCFLWTKLKHMKSYKHLLDTEMVNIDKEFYLEISKDVNAIAYHSYKKNYLYAQDYPKTNYEIIKQEIETIINNVSRQ